MYKFLSKNNYKNINECIKTILNYTGFKINSKILINKLKNKSLEINEESGIVKIDEKQLEITISKLYSCNNKSNYPVSPNGTNQDMLNSKHISGVVGGGCIEFFDYEIGKCREPLSKDLVNTCLLCEEIDEIAYVGDSLIVNYDTKLNKLEENLKNLYSTALLCKSTSKPGTCESNSVKDLEYQIQMGSILRDSLDNFRKNPCLYESIIIASPLCIDKIQSEMLLKLVEYKLPVPVLSAPICGLQAPPSIIGSLILISCEILALATIIRIIDEEVSIIPTSIIGHFDIENLTISYGGPEILLQKLLLKQFWQEFYNLDIGVSLDYTSDAKYPGMQMTIERIYAVLGMQLKGFFIYPFGIFNSSRSFSLEQVLIDLSIYNYINPFKELIISDIANFDCEKEMDLIRR